MNEITDSNNTQLRILVVDDSDVILQALRSFFEDYNFEVVTCSDGLEGLQKSVEWKPNVIFLDLMMPNFDGLKMLQVKKVLPDIKDIPVIVISANTDRRNVIAAIEAGADKVISKPLQKDLIIKYLSELLGDQLFASRDTSKGIGGADNEQMKKDLAQFFLSTFEDKRMQILRAVDKKNVPKLKEIVHEIRGAGGTIGYPILTQIAGEIEEKEITSDTDWMFIELKCSQLMQFVRKIEEEISKK